ncbi:hypothetical protein P8452_37819 [Trifolium repens]|nr:hypothetical protein P8452_37819 [Trifolium repens]
MKMDLKLQTQFEEERRKKKGIIVISLDPIVIKGILQASKQASKACPKFASQNPNSITSHNTSQFTYTDRSHTRAWTLFG